MIEFIEHNVHRLDRFKFSTLLVLVYSHYHHTYITSRPHITVYCTMSHISTWYTLHVEVWWYLIINSSHQLVKNIYTHQKAHFTSYQTLHYKDLEVYLPIL